MRIRISDPEFTRDLRDYLRRNECAAIQTGRGTVAVSFLKPIPCDAAHMELDLRLADWRELHADVSTVVIE
jgi:hypothetical protein